MAGVDDTARMRGVVRLCACVLLISWHRGVRRSLILVDSPVGICSSDSEARLAYLCSTAGYIA